MNRTRNRLAGTVAFGRRVVALLGTGETSFLAAGIAYYAFVSFVPALTLAFAVASLVGGEELAATALSVAGEALSPVGRDLVADALAGARGRAPVTLFGVAVLAGRADETGTNKNLRVDVRRDDSA